MLSRHYYGWHLKEYSHLVHIMILIGASLFSAYFIFNSVSQIIAADTPAQTADSSLTTGPVAVSTAANNPPAESSELLQELSKLATNETLKIIANKVGPVSTLSSEQTQLEIRDKIEASLAKDSSVLTMITTIRQNGLDNQAALSSLSAILSKVGTETTLATLVSKLETDLAKEQTLAEISLKMTDDPATDQTLLEIKAQLEASLAQGSTLEDLAENESGLAKDRTLSDVGDKIETGLAKDATIQQMITALSTQLEDINDKLAGSISVTVGNWATSIAVTNFPTDYPSSSVEAGQEAIGSDSFNRSLEFETWALRKDYAQTAFSGEITNPKNGAEIEGLRMTVPAGHTYYVSRIIISSDNTKNTIFKLYYKSNGGVESNISRLIVPSKDSKSIDFDKKLKANDEFRLTLEPVSNSTLTSTITIFYYDLPWAE